MYLATIANWGHYLAITNILIYKIMYILQTILLYISIYHNKKILVYINYKHINLKKNYKIKISTRSFKWSTTCLCFFNQSIVRSFYINPLICSPGLSYTYTYTYTYAYAYAYAYANAYAYTYTYTYNYTIQCDTRYDTITFFQCSFYSQFLQKSLEFWQRIGVFNRIIEVVEVI